MRTVIVSRRPSGIDGDAAKFLGLHGDSCSDLHAAAVGRGSPAPFGVWTEPDQGRSPTALAAAYCVSERRRPRRLSSDQSASVVRHAQRFVLMTGVFAWQIAEACRQARWLGAINPHAEVLFTEDASVQSPRTPPLKSTSSVEPSVAPTLISAHLEARFARRFSATRANSRLLTMELRPTLPPRTTSLSFLELQTLPLLVYDTYARGRIRALNSFWPLDQRSVFAQQPGSLAYEAVKSANFALAWKRIKAITDTFGLAVALSPMVVLTNDGRDFLGYLAPSFFDAEFVERRKRWIAAGFEASRPEIDAYVDRVCDAQDAFERQGARKCA